MFTSNMLYLRKKKKKGKDKMFLFLIKHCAMKVYGGSVDMAPSMFFFKTLAVDGGERSGSWPNHLTPWVMAVVSTVQLTSWAPEKA